MFAKEEMSKLDAPTTYVRLGLAINRLFPGYVDAYFGPPELRAAVEAQANPSLGDLEALADSLNESIEAGLTLAANRREFLSAELRAMRTTIRILRGDVPDIVDEVHSLYGVRPQWVDEGLFDDAHSALDQVLPGAGPLSRRVADFRERSRVPAEIAAPVLREFADDLRQRARSRFALPAREDVETTFVRDKPWMAYNWFLGNGRSLIEINQDRPLEMCDLPNLVAHEAYPGHHTEYSIKEELLYRQGRCLEQSIRLSNTPSALISEGIATNALQAVASQDEIASMLLHCYEAAGLSRGDAARAHDFNIAMRPLQKVFDNQVLLLFRDRVSEDEVVAYGMRHALNDETQARQELRFVKDPLGRSYSYNYTLGRDLVATLLDASPDRTQAFARLLSEQWTPGEIERSITR